MRFISSCERQKGGATESRAALVSCLFLVEPHVFEHIERLRADRGAADRQRDAVDARPDAATAAAEAATATTASTTATAAALRARRRARGCCWRRGRLSRRTATTAG